MASVGYRYRKWNLDGGITLVARCQHDAVISGPNGEIQYITVKALNEWDPRNNAKSGYQVCIILVWVHCLLVLQLLATTVIFHILCSIPVEWSGGRNWTPSEVPFWLTSSEIMRASWLNGQFRLSLPALTKLNSGKVLLLAFENKFLGACLNTDFKILDMFPVSMSVTTPTMLSLELNNSSRRNLLRRSV